MKRLETIWKSEGAERILIDLVLVSANSQSSLGSGVKQSPCQICTELKSSREKQKLKMSFSNEPALYFS